MIRVKSLAIAGILVCAGFAPAEDMPSTPERRVVEIKHLSGDRLRRATEIVSNFLQPNGDAKADSSLGVVLLRGPVSSLTAAEALLKRFDVPASARADTQIQFTIYLVEASQEEGKSGPIPAAITSAVDQMKKSFQYKNYRLLDTILLQARSGGPAELNGILPSLGPGKDIRAPYQLSMGNVDLLEDGKSVAISKFRFSLRVPQSTGSAGQFQFYDAGLNTNLTVQRGQKLVIGKVSSEEGQSAIFLIITTEIQ